MLNAFRHQRINHQQRGRRIHSRTRVLNAFRHQRINHLGSQFIQKILDRGAQRLSASKDKSQKAGVVAGQNTIGAQRLSASKDKSHATIFFELNPVLPVLNAFRHQRINHTALARVELSMLSSAQRLSASKDKSHCDGPQGVSMRCACSTPFGIKG